MKLTTNTWVVIADGAKYLVLRQHGDEEFIDLRVQRARETDNLSTREWATDRPGRMYDSGRSGGKLDSSAPKSAFQETDWHVVEEQRFAQHVAEKLCDWAAKGQFDKLVVIADPRTLGVLRKAYADRLNDRILAEIAKDFTNMPIADIEAALRDYKP